MRLTLKTRLARKDFPISYSDTLLVRDGEGRIVERWRLSNTVPWSAGKNLLTFLVTEYGRAV